MITFAVWGVWWRMTGPVGNFILYGMLSWKYEALFRQLGLPIIGG